MIGRSTQEVRDRQTPPGLIPVFIGPRPCETGASFKPCQSFSQDTPAHVSSVRVLGYPKDKGKGRNTYMCLLSSHMSVPFFSWFKWNTNGTTYNICASYPRHMGALAILSGRCCFSNGKAHMRALEFLQPLFLGQAGLCRKWLFKRVSANTLTSKDKQRQSIMGDELNLHWFGSKLNNRGYTGFGPCFHLPGQPILVPVV